jgi:thioredoxin
MKTQHTFEVTTDNFQAEVLQSSVPVLVDFTADWCPPCKMIAPLVDALAVTYEGKLRVGTLDSDIHFPIVETYDVQGLPTLILFQNGKPIHRMIGFRPAHQLEAEILQHLQLEKA